MFEPGALIFASGNDFLNVNRGNQLVANGTASDPIIFTSRQNIEGSVSADSSGQWGGIILSGRAPVTDCFVGSEAANTCQRRVEGATNQILYGGTQTGEPVGEHLRGGVALGDGLEDQPAELVVLDIGLGPTARLHGQRVDGIAVCQFLKAQPGAPAVILLTAHAFDGDEVRFLEESGADAYEPKPIRDEDEFLVKLGSLLT